MPSGTSDLRGLLERTGAPAGVEVRRGEGWVVHVDDIPAGPEAFAHSVARGLSDQPRWLHCRYLYDGEGSRIFQRITEQPEYYPTRAEAEILRRHAGEIREAVGDVPLVELGAGSGEKTRWLLEAWAARSDRVEYVPLDIDPSVLVGAAERLSRELPAVEVRGLATSYERGLEALARRSPMCLLFLGSTIGNLNPDETDDFLARLERTLSPEDTLLLGVDLVKDPDVLEAAYDDAAGWSAAFTRNLFARMNRELGTEIDPDSVDHVAWWNDRLERIEIYARFRRTTQVELASIGRRFRVAAGETVLTEISRKFRPEKIEADLARFGFRLERSFTDSGERFALLLFRRVEASDRPPQWMRLAARLQGARRRTLDLMDALSEADLRRQVLPHLSPIAWDLGHMAEFERLWLVDTIDALADGVEPRATMEAEYDAARTPRETRGALSLPDRDELFRRLRRVREDALERLQRTSLGGHPLLEEGFVYRMLAQHEAQHQETLLQAVARMEDVVYEPAHRTPPPRAELPPDVDMVLVPAGPFPVGAAGDPSAYDNERPAHAVDLAAFWIDAAPVTNGAFLGFVERDGYRHREWWTEAGWAWLQEAEVEHPLGWRRTANGWAEVGFGREGPLVPTRPVMHVSAHEADAYARSTGKRLPTELEWEKAAAWDPEVRVSRHWPWGDHPPTPRRANLDAITFAPALVGAFPAGRSFYGCHQMIGDVWEWTSSEFGPYPGFRAFPYPEYSEVHFGEGYRVLRGGSWATASIVARNTFRNWDWPHRRQIFAGIRCARDA
ncbi:MAG TPA: ergothioneine biosynthesis protein EgtB [Gemmatimonadota bacterium]|nr:ergothioneine biosynthesis protein EgtB [Gemmatimonadota bacterium]